MKFLKLYHSVKHTRRKQLIHRLRLKARRKLNVVRAKTLRAKMLQDSPLTKLNTPLPAPLLPARTGNLSIHDGVYSFTLIGQKHSFAHPIDWHRPELDYGTRLWLLNLHYMEYLEETDDDVFARLVADWIDNCPPYGSNYWLYDWNSYSLSIRCVVWMQQYTLRHERLDADFKQRMLVSLVRQLRFLADNLELDIGGNHLVKNIKALLWAARFFDIPEAQQWRELGHYHLKNEVEEQILEDGMHYERSPAYHTQVFADLVDVYSVLESETQQIKLKQTLSTMAQVMVDLTHPDQQISVFNDGGLNMTYQPSECVDAWSKLSTKVCKPNKHVALQAAGYFGIRNENDFLLVDCGNIAPDFLPAHGHGDILAFEWSVDSKRVFVDFGVFEYNPGELRRLSRATESHNTVTIDNADQCEFWGAFRVARRTHPKLIEYQPDENGFKLIGSHDGYRNLPGHPIHQREFLVESGSSFTIVDSVIGGQSQSVCARLLVHPQFKLTQHGQTILLNNLDTNIEIKTNGKIKIKKHFWCSDFGYQEDCYQIEVDYGTAPCKEQMTIKKV